MSDPTVQKQYVYLDQPEPSLWRKSAWNLFSLMLGGLPSVYIASRTLDEYKEKAAIERAERERTSQEARVEREKTSQEAREMRASQEAREVRASQEAREERAVIAAANARIWKYNASCWLDRNRRPLVSTKEEAQAVLVDVSPWAGT